MVKTYFERYGTSPCLSHKILVEKQVVELDSLKVQVAGVKKFHLEYQVKVREFRHEAGAPIPVAVLVPIPFP